MKKAKIAIYNGADEAIQITETDIGLTFMVVGQTGSGFAKFVIEDVQTIADFLNTYLARNPNDVGLLP